MKVVCNSRRELIVCQFVSLNILNIKLHGEHETNMKQTIASERKHECLFGSSLEPHHPPKSFAKMQEAKEYTNLAKTSTFCFGITFRMARNLFHLAGIGNN